MARILSAFVLMLVYGVAFAGADPTRPPGATSVNGQSAAQQPVLQAILHSADRRRAILNDDVYAVGDSIGRYRVRSIQAQRVVLTGPQGPLVLHLFSQDLP